MAKSYEEIAKEVVEAVGGKENIASFAHCATRLRIMVNDESKIDKERVDEIEKVKGIMFNSGQYQIIFGTGTVNKVYEAVQGLGGVSESSVSDMKKEAAKQGNIIQRISRTFGDIFVPIIPVLVATGLFMGLRGLLTNENLLKLLGTTPKSINPNFLMYTQVLTDTAFIILPALVAWSAFKVFGGSPVLGIVLGSMLISSSLPNAYQVASGDAHPIMFFNFIPVVGYQGTVLPALFVGMIGAKLEQRLRKVIPDALDLLLTPFLVFLIMSTLGLFVIGPIFHSLENYILIGTEWILKLPFGIAGIIIGGLQQLIVVTGVHHIFNFLEIQLLAKDGFNQFNPLLSAAVSFILTYMFVAVAGQFGAVLAVGVKTKDKKLKALALPSALSAALGITEPAIYGVNLIKGKGKPFLMGLAGGAAGGFLASVFGLKASGMAVTVIPGILLFLNAQLPLYLVSIIVGAGVSFALTYTFVKLEK